jgi:DtxR family Mn-dependent transcriptional regulator
MIARRQLNANSESVDNYLKAILSLGGPEEQRVTSSALADRLAVAPASVTNMLQRLATSLIPLVEYERHRGVRLSEAGKRRALEVLRHHRLLETFLYQVLDYPVEEVHEEAERLEHFISERFEERIAAKLGQPTIDPHGHCIPAMDGKMPRENSLPLTSVGEEAIVVVDSITDRNPATVKLLRMSGIAPGVQLRATKRHPEDGYTLRIDGVVKPLHLSHEAANAVRIQPPR